MPCADLEGGSGGSGPPLEFAKLNIADITGNEKISYFSYLCTSPVIRQTKSILLKVGPPLEKFSGSAPECRHIFAIYERERERERERGGSINCNALLIFIFLPKE